MQRALCALAIASACSTALAQNAQPLRRRFIPVKSEISELAPGQRQDIVHVKFHDDLPFRVRNGVLDDGGSGLLNALDQALGIASRAGWIREHSVDEASLDELRVRAQDRGGEEVVDFSSYFFWHIPDYISASDAIDALNLLDIVELAEAVWPPAPPPTVPDLQSQQGYLLAAPDGVASSALWGVPGGNGAWTLPNGSAERSKIAVLDYDFNAGHGDLPSVAIVPPLGAYPFGMSDHGTAALGILISLHDTVGTTGSVFGALPSFVSPCEFSSHQLGGSASFGGTSWQDHGGGSPTTVGT